MVLLLLQISSYNDTFWLGLLHFHCYFRDFSHFLASPFLPLRSFSCNRDWFIAHTICTKRNDTNGTMYQENSSIYFLKNKCRFAHMASQHEPITTNWHNYTNWGLRDMKNLTPIVFHEHNIAMHNYTYNLNEIKVLHQRCKLFLCLATFLFESAHCCLLFLIIAAPHEPKIPDLLQIFLSFSWGLILWTNSLLL